MKMRALMVQWPLAAVTLLLAAALLPGCASTPANTAAQPSARDEAQVVVDSAKATLDDMLRDPNYASMQEGLKSARGVLIFPRIYKAAFVLGGSGGRGVLLVRGPNGEWSQPAFYSTAAVSLGFQIGGEAAETVMLVNSDRALRSFYNPSLKFGGDVGVALGPVGSGRQKLVRADLVAYSKNKGAYAGIDLQGVRLNVRNDLNDAYYGRQVTPEQILERHVTANAGATGLRRDLRRYAG